MTQETEWNENLFGCFNDCGSCCYGFCCTPCLFGSNAEKIDGKNCCLMSCLYLLLGGIYLCWVPHYLERQKLREKYNLRSNPSCGDCLTTLLCSPCALCQEAREIKSRENQVQVDLKDMARQPVVAQPGAGPKAENPVNVRV